MRYFQQPPQQQLVNMESPVNVDFYRSILDKAQQDLNTSTAIKAKFLEDAYGNKYLDEITRNREIAKAEDMFKGALDSPFVSPAKLGQTAIKAGAQLAKWKNLNEKHLEQIKLQQEMRARSGGSYVGNDVASMSLTDQNTGELVDPSKIQAISGNGEDLQKMFLADNGHLATRTSKGNHKTYPIMGGQFIEFSDSTIKGLTPQEAANYGNSAVVKEYMQKLPDLAEAVKASGQDVEKYFSQNLSRIAGQLVQGTQESISHASNSNWQPSGYKPSGKGNGVVSPYQPVTDPNKKEKSGTDRVRDLLSGVDNSNNEHSFNSPSMAGLGMPTNITNPNVFGKSQEEIKKMHKSETENMTWNQAKREITPIRTKFSGTYDRMQNDFEKTNGKLDDSTPEGRENTRKFYHSFLNQADVYEKDGLAPKTVWNIRDKDAVKNLTRALELGSSMIGGTEFRGTDGSRMPSSSIYKGGIDNITSMPTNEGNIVVVKDGKSYTADVFDKNGVPTGILDATNQKVFKFIRDMRDGIFDNTTKNFNSAPKSMGEVPIVVPNITNAAGEPVLAIPYYYFSEPGKGGGDKNTVSVAYKDISNNKFIPQDATGNSLRPVDFDEVIKDAVQVIKYINAN